MEKGTSDDEADRSPAKRSRPRQKKGKLTLLTLLDQFLSLTLEMTINSKIQVTSNFCVHESTIFFKYLT